MSNRSQKNKLRVIILGYGGMGRHHLRLARQNSELELIGVIDPHMPSIDGLMVFPSLEVFQDQVQKSGLQKPDLAIVATPIPTHTALVFELLTLGYDVFVEKPITETIADALRLKDFAMRRGRTLFVGQSERYNPAFVVFREQFKTGITGPVYRIECNRTGPFPQGIGDTGVSIDLAVHDLDCIHSIMGNQLPIWVMAQTKRQIHPTQEDDLQATLGYAQSVIMTMNVNRLSSEKNRSMDVYGHLGVLHCDFLLQKVSFIENALQLNMPERNFEIPKWEALAKEHEALIRLVRNGWDDESRAALESACQSVHLVELFNESALLNARIEVSRKSV